MSKQSFLKGAIILTLAGFISRMLGAIYRIPLSRLIGSEGLGLYQMAYPMYSMALVFSAAGIPLAISKLVAEKMAANDRKSAYRIFKVAMVLLIITGIIFTGGLLWGAKFFAGKILRDQRAVLSMLAIAPAVFFITIASAFRGLFQGLQNMVPPANAQIVEQIVRVSAMLGMAYLLLPYGIEYAAAGAAFGGVIGSIGGLLALIGFFRKLKKQFFADYLQRGEELKESAISIIIKLFKLSVPISIGSMVMPVVQLADAIIVPMRLQQAGYTVAQSTNLFGQLTGMALGLIYLPTIITSALAISLVPAVSEANILGKKALMQLQIQKALKLTLLIGLPAAIGLNILAHEISGTLFNTPEAGEPLKILALGVIFLCLIQTSSGILQGLGKVMLCLNGLIVGAVCKIVGNYYLTAVPSLGIKGAAIGTVVGLLITATINMNYLMRSASFSIDFKNTVLKPILALAGMVMVINKSYQVFFDASKSNSLATLSAICIGGCVYGGLLLFTGCITVKEMETVPGLGPKIANILKKLRIG